MSHKVLAFVSLLTLAMSACGTSHAPPSPDGGPVADGSTRGDGGGGVRDGGGGGTDSGTECGVECPEGSTCCPGCPGSAPSCSPGLGCPDIICKVVWTTCDAALAGGTTGDTCSFSDGCGMASTCCSRMARCEGGLLVIEEECAPGCGACATSADCTPDQFCAHPTGGCGGPGYCTARPTACTRDCPEVCGCDGVTYCNECNANAAGTAIASDGACGRACGGRGTPPCDPGDYCDWADGSCGRDDGTGSCRTRPSACPDIYAPVCGCDGVTYPNDCDAAAVGIDYVHIGTCDDPPPPPDDCRVTGCPSGMTCEPCWATYACLPPGAVC